MSELTGNTKGTRRVSFPSPNANRRCATTLASFKTIENRNQPPPSLPKTVPLTGNFRPHLISKPKQGLRGQSYTLTASTKSPSKRNRKAKPTKTMPSKENLLSNFEKELHTNLYALFQSAILVSFGKIGLKESKTELAISFTTSIASKAPGVKLIGQLAKEGKKYYRKKGYKEINNAIIGKDPWVVSGELTQQLLPLISHELCNEKDYSRLLTQTLSWVSKHLKTHSFDSYETCIQSVVHNCNSRLLSG